MHVNYKWIKSDNVCAFIVVNLSEFVRLSEIVGHEKESRTGQSDMSDKSRTQTPALEFLHHLVRLFHH